MGSINATLTSAFEYLRTLGRDVSVLDSASLTSPRRIYVDGEELLYPQVIELAKKLGFRDKHVKQNRSTIHNPGGKPKKLRTTKVPKTTAQ